MKRGYVRVLVADDGRETIEWIGLAAIGLILFAGLLLLTQRVTPNVGEAIINVLRDLIHLW